MAFIPPQSVQNNAKRGLELRRKHGRGGLSTQEAGAQGIGSGVARATSLANGDALSLDTVKRMVAFFGRHQKNKDSRMPNGEPGAGMIAWLLWGGDAGRVWAEAVVRREGARAEKAMADAPNYRPVGTASLQRCGTCSHFTDSGRCDLYDFKANAMYTCDSWRPDIARLKKARQGGETTKEVSATPTAVYAHGPGGLFSPAGLGDTAAGTRKRKKKRKPAPAKNGAFNAMLITTKPGDKYDSIKNPKVYEALRKRGMSKSQAAAISNAMAKRSKGKKKEAAAVSLLEQAKELRQSPKETTPDKLECAKSLRLKHASHNQASHGFRFGATPSLEQARRYRKAGVLQEYSKRSRERTGTKPSKQRQAEKPKDSPSTTPWKYTAAQYQSDKGVHQPWIAEISPMQYGNMSKRQQEAYDKKRSAEWQASADVKREWRQKVTDAFDAGKIKRDTPGLSDEAKSVITHHMEANRKQSADQIMKTNRIPSIDAVSVGDRVFDLMSGRYARVTKKLKNSVVAEWEKRAAWETSPTGKIKLGALQWHKYNDAMELALQGLPLWSVKETKKTQSTFTVFKDKTGRYRWVAISSTAYRDRDGEIVSTKALTDDVQRADANGDYGPLRWWHVDGLDLGDCDFNMVYGRSLIESGTFKNDRIAERVKENAHSLKLSLGFRHPANEPDTAGVFHNIRRFERSLIPPEGNASNLFTRLAVT